MNNFSPRIKAAWRRARASGNVSDVDETRTVHVNERILNDVYRYDPFPGPYYMWLF
jgi:hypothetical protein